MLSVTIQPKRFIFLLFLFTTGLFNLYSESVFSLDLKTDIVITTLGLGLFLGGTLPVSEPSIPNNLSRDDVNVFDKWLMFPNNDTVHIVRDRMRWVIPILPAITPLVCVIGNDFKTWLKYGLTYGLMYTQAIQLTIGTVYIIKRPVNRYRPRYYFDGFIDYPIDDDSFPSDTTAYTFMSATFLSYTFSAEFPLSPWKFPIIIGSYALATTVTVMSIASGQHYLTDVLVSAAIGAFYGWIIPTLHRTTIHRTTNKEKRISFHFTGNGGIITVKW